MSEFAAPLIMLSTFATVGGDLMKAEAGQEASLFNVDILAQQADILVEQAETWGIQAELSELTAEMERIKGESEVIGLQKEKRQTTGEQVTGYLASGVKLEGSPALVMESTKAAYDLDIATARYNAQVGVVSELSDVVSASKSREATLKSAKSYLTEAEYELENEQAETAASYLAAVGSLLEGGSLLAGTYELGDELGWWK